MAKPKTRRSISVRGLTYQRLEDFCKTNGFSVSGYVEHLIAEKLDALGVLSPTELRPRERYSKPVTSEEIISQHFTF